MSLAKKIFGVGAWTAASRILGFARDMLVGRFLGAGFLSDVFLTAFKLPNLFRDLLGEGALSSVFVPMFAKEKRDADFASNAFSWLMLTLLILTLAAEIFMPFLVMGLAPGFEAEKLLLTTQTARIMFVYVILVCGAGFLSATLNAFSDFALAAAAPILLNVFLIGGLLTFGADLKMLSLSVLAAGAVQMTILWGRLRRRNFGLRIIFPRMNGLIKNMLGRMSWGFLGSGFYQLNVLVGVLIASYDSGAVSYLYYGDRMVQLPFAIIGLAAGTVILTKVSDALSAGKIPAVHRYQNAAMRQSLMLMLPCATGLIVLAEPIIRILFEHGAWTPTATSAVARVIMIQALALPIMTLSQVYLKTLYASGDAKTPVKISAATLGLAVIVMIALVGHLGYLSVPVGTLVGGLVRNWWLTLECGRRGLQRTHWKTRILVGIFLFLSVIMGIGLFFARPFVTDITALTFTLTLAPIIYLPIAIVCDKIVMRSPGRF